jgi:hypothetical protein
MKAYKMSGIKNSTYFSQYMLNTGHKFGKIYEILESIRTAKREKKPVSIV